MVSTASTFSLLRLLRLTLAAGRALLKVAPRIPGAYRIIQKRERLIAEHGTRLETDRLDRIRNPHRYRGRK